MLVVVLVGALGLVIDSGIYRSRRWAFFASLALSLCVTGGLIMTAGTGAFSIWSVMQIIGLLAYSMLRLCRAFGPTLR